MARKRRPLDELNEKNLLLSTLENEPAGWRRERLLAVKLGLEGELSYDQIGAQLQRGVRTIQDWFNAFRIGGVEKLLTKEKGNGPAPRVSGKVSEELQEKLKAGEFRTGGQVLRWLKEEHNIQMHPNSIYHVLGKHGGRLKVPRPVHRHRNEERAEAFKETLCDRIHALNIPDPGKVRVWVQDEMRTGLHSVVRRAWGLCGERIVKAVEQRFDWEYVYGALEVDGDGAEFSYLPYVRKDTTQQHLEQISKSDPESVHVVIWDGAGFHHQDGDESLPDNIRLIKLPPYSPELNPVEKLWDIVKDWICNRVYADLDELAAWTTQCLRPYWEDAQKVRSLIGEGWLLNEVNATS